MARDLGVDSRVEIGGVPGSRREEMAALLQEAALVVQLSEYESQSISIAEALAMGRPVLVADGTALRELADRGLAQMVAAGCPPRETALAILKQLEEPLEPVVPRLPTWEDCAASVLALYRAALSGRASG
jgi:glycosyltransferase involved in cell wall biosynthesis